MTSKFHELVDEAGDFDDMLPSYVFCASDEA